MNRSIYNARNYRKHDLRLGDMATTEKFYTNATLIDTNGDVVTVNGIVEIWGTVIEMYDNHCTVLVTELRFNKGESIVPIKFENRFKTSINYWKASNVAKERMFIAEVI